MMFCRYCGKQIPDDSVFCQYCGQRLDTATTTEQPTRREEQPAKREEQPTGWDYLTVIIHYRKGEGGWVLQDKYPAPLAQQTFWSDAKPIIDELEVVMADNGCQPIGEHGPTCVELASYKSTEGHNPLAMAARTIATYGTSLLFERSWKFTVKTITLKWRRLSTDENTSEETFHMWFNAETGELERWEFNYVSKQWVRMDMNDDEDSSRSQKPAPLPAPSSVPGPTFSSGEDVPRLPRASTHSSQLTEEERRIVSLLARGFSNPEIATRLDQNPVHTITVTKELLARFGVETEDELVRVVREQGFSP